MALRSAVPLPSFLRGDARCSTGDNTPWVLSLRVVVIIVHVADDGRDVTSLGFTKNIQSTQDFPPA
jgi:hypothetical protein